MQHFRQARFQPRPLARRQNHHRHVFVGCHVESIVPCPAPFDNLSLQVFASKRDWTPAAIYATFPQNAVLSYLLVTLIRGATHPMNCPYCAELIPDDTRFCPKCGTQMGTPLPGSPHYVQPLPPGFVPPTSGKAIGSLVAGLFFFFLPASIVAVVLGHLSLSEIRK